MAGDLFRFRLAANAVAVERVADHHIHEPREAAA